MQSTRWARTPGAVELVGQCPCLALGTPCQGRRDHMEDQWLVHGIPLVGHAGPLRCRPLRQEVDGSSGTVRTPGPAVHRRPLGGPGASRPSAGCGRHGCRERVWSSLAAGASRWPVNGGTPERLLAVPGGPARRGPVDVDGVDRVGSRIVRGTFSEGVVTAWMSGWPGRAPACPDAAGGGAPVSFVDGPAPPRGRSIRWSDWLWLRRTWCSVPWHRSRVGCAGRDRR